MVSLAANLELFVLSRNLFICVLPSNKSNKKFYFEAFGDPIIIKVQQVSSRCEKVDLDILNQLLSWFTKDKTRKNHENSTKNHASMLSSHKTNTSTTPFISYNSPSAVANGSLLPACTWGLAKSSQNNFHRVST